MYRYRLNDVPKRYFACTEIVLQKHMYRNWSHMYRSRHVPKLSTPCTETVMYRKRPNPMVTGVLLQWVTLSFRLNQVLNSVFDHSLNSTQRTSKDSGVKTPQCPHLSSHFCLYIKYYNQLDSRTDLSPIPVRSALKSYKTSWCIRNLSKRALNRQTVSTSTTKLGRIFQMLTKIRF